MTTLIEILNAQFSAAASEEFDDLLGGAPATLPEAEDDYRVATAAIAFAAMRSGARAAVAAGLDTPEAEEEDRKARRAFLQAMAAKLLRDAEDRC